MLRKKPIHFVICGNYGASNLGDEAILDGILNLIHETFSEVEVTVLSSHPEETTTLHNVQSFCLFPAGFRSFIKGFFGGTFWQTLKAVKKTDLFILGGGGLFTDEKLRAVFIWWMQAAFARLLKKPLFCFGQSVGPLKTFWGRMLTKKVFKKAQMISVRDQASLFIIKKMGIEKVETLADPAFCIKFEEPSQLIVGSLSGREKFVIFSIRPWLKKADVNQYHVLAQFIDWLHEKYNLRSILVPFQIVHDNDLEPLESILSHVKHREAATIYEYTSDHQKVLELISRSYAVIGMRLHSLIFSTIAQTPFLALSYSQKVTEFVKMVEGDPLLFFWEDIKLEALQKGFSDLSTHYGNIQNKLSAKRLQLHHLAGNHVQLLQRFKAFAMKET